MAKFSVAEFMKTAATITAGVQAGKMQGELLRRQQESQDRDDRMQAFRLLSGAMQDQYHQQQQGLLGRAKSAGSIAGIEGLDPAQQAAAYEQMAGYEQQASELKAPDAMGLFGRMMGNDPRFSGLIPLSGEGNPLHSPAATPGDPYAIRPVTAAQAGPATPSGPAGLGRLRIESPEQRELRKFEREKARAIELKQLDIDADKASATERLAREQTLEKLKQEGRAKLAQQNISARAFKTEGDFVRTASAAFLREGGDPNALPAYVQMLRGLWQDRDTAPDTAVEDPAAAALRGLESTGGLIGAPSATSTQLSAPIGQPDFFPQGTRAQSGIAKDVAATAVSQARAADIPLNAEDRRARVKAYVQSVGSLNDYRATMAEARKLQVASLGKRLELDYDKLGLEERKFAFAKVKEAFDQKLGLSRLALAQSKAQAGSKSDPAFKAKELLIRQRIGKIESERNSLETKLAAVGPGPQGKQIMSQMNHLGVQLQGLLDEHAALIGSGGGSGAANGGGNPREQFIKRMMGHGYSRQDAIRKAASVGL